MPSTFISAAPPPKNTPTTDGERFPANCVRPAVCTLCGETQGVALGHTWVAATYEQPRHCSVCGEIEGEPLAPTPEPTPTAEYYYEQARIAMDEADYAGAARLFRQSGDYADTAALADYADICRRAAANDILVPDINCFLDNRRSYSAAGQSGNGIYLRKKPTVSGMSVKEVKANILCTLPDGTRMTAWAAMNGFSFVEVEDGSVGWVDSTKVKNR